MSKERTIDGIRLYSDNLENNVNTTKKVEYKKVEKTTTTKTVIKGGNQTSKKIETTTKINKNYGLPGTTKNYTFGQIKESRSVSSGLFPGITSSGLSKSKFNYEGKLKEKENYVSGKGFMKKDEKWVKQENKSKPIREIRQRITIVIQNKRPERKGGELVENFEYHETKDFGKNNRESIVVHRRLGDPFYQSINGKKRSSTYTQAGRGKSNISLEKDETKTVTDYTKIKNKTITTTDYRVKKTTENKTIDTSKYTSNNYQKNKYQNNTYNTTKSTQSNQSSQSGFNKGISNKYNQSYQRTINVEERKRNIVPKTQFEKTYTETNNRRNAAPVQPRKTQDNSKDQKKYIPSTKKYQEKSEDSYSRKNQSQNQNKNQYNPNLNKKVFDTEKYKRKEEPKKYQQKTEETYKSQMTGYSKKEQESQEGQGIGEDNMVNDPNYCPIHGYHGQGQGHEKEGQNIYGQGESNINIMNNNMSDNQTEEIDNYKFYESKCFSSKTQNINTNININTLNRINAEENINTINTDNNMNEMNMRNTESQEQMVQGEEGYDLSKLYIATKIIPVYSDMLGSQYQYSHVCNVCGNPFEENQINIMQQNQMNSMQEMAYDNNCPIHGQNMMQQQVNEC